MVYWMLAVGRVYRGSFMSFEEQAKDIFNSEYNCAESVLLAVSRQTTATREGFESLIPRIASGFGGGIARNGDICEALAGGIMAISLSLGRDRPDESREPCYAAVDRFYSDFRKTFGTCNCRELTGINLKMLAQSDPYRKRMRTERCNPIVAWAAKKTHQIIRETQHCRG